MVMNVWSTGKVRSAQYDDFWADRDDIFQEDYSGEGRAKALLSKIGIVALAAAAIAAGASVLVLRS